MRFWRIAVLIFSFSMSVSIVTTTFVDSGIYNLGPRFETADETTGTINETIENLNTTVGQVTSESSGLWSYIYSASLLLSGITLFVQTLGNATILLPWLMQRFYFPPGLAWGISSIVWFVYGMAIIQFLANRAGKGME